MTNALDGLFSNMVISSDEGEVITRKRIRFVGIGWEVTDDPIMSETVISLPLVSLDGTFGLKSLSAENRQVQDPLADDGDHVLSVALPFNEFRYYVTWFLLVDGDSYRYFVEYDRDDEGTITVVSENEISGALPASVTLETGVGEGVGTVTITNSTGSGIRSTGNPA